MGRVYRVGVAPPVQQEVLVLHIRKAFRVEGHADKMEVGVEAVDLEGILDVVMRRTVTVVIGISASSTIHNGSYRRYGVGRGQRIAA
jgi:hypothetical protein